MGQRSPYVETLRGFAILLVVMGHVIGDSVSGGMRVSDDSIWRFFYFNIDKLQMPLFTIISGWVYAIRPFTRLQNLGHFTGQKAQRLLIPMLVVASIYFIIKSLSKSNAEEQIGEIWKLLVFPYNVYWYLPSLFWTFIIVALFDRFRCMDKLAPTTMILILSILMYKYQNLLIPESFPNYFSFKGTLYLLPFFIAGIAIQRFKAVFSDKRVTFGLWGLFIGCMVIVQLVWFQIIGNGYQEFGRNSWLGIITGVASVALFFTRVQISALVWIGGFSYSIYLFHSIIKGISQEVLVKLHLNNELLVFASGVACGVLCSILADVVLSRWKITGYLFLGKKKK